METNQQQETEPQVGDHIESLFQKTGDYLETRLELGKLKAVDKTSDVLSTAISSLIVIVVFLMVIALINIGIGFWLGELLGKTYYGFFALGGFYLIIGLIVKAMRKKWFKEPIADNIIRKILK